MKEKTKKDIEQLANKKYSAGFISDIKTYKIPMGLNEDIIKLISEKKNEPKDILKLRLSAFKKWKEMKEPKWADFEVPTIDYQKITYYSSPITDDENSPKSLEVVAEKKSLLSIISKHLFSFKSAHSSAPAPSKPVRKCPAAGQGLLSRSLPGGGRRRDHLYRLLPGW